MFVLFFNEWFAVLALGISVVVSAPLGFSSTQFLLAGFGFLASIGFKYLHTRANSHPLDKFSSADNIHLHREQGTFISELYPIVRRLYARRSDLASSCSKVIKFTEHSATEIGSCVKNISTMAKQQVDDTVQLSAQFSETTNDTASVSYALKETIHLLNDSLQALTELVKMNTELKEALHSARESASAISANALAMKELAFRTKLLSFNARLEASRAGTHGVGFAVVAEEVNNLSSRAQVLADEIEVTSERINREMLEFGNKIDSTNEATALRQQDLEFSIGTISVTATQASETARGLTKGALERAQDVARNINEIVTHLQFQDLSRQELEKAQAKIELSWGKRFANNRDLEGRLMALQEQLQAFGLNESIGYPEINPELEEFQVASSINDRHKSSSGNVILFSEQSKSAAKTATEQDAAAGDVLLF